MGQPGGRAYRESTGITDPTSHETVMSEKTIPPQLEEIIEGFQWCQGREKLEYLLEFSEQFSPLPERYQNGREEFESVPECMTPVFVHAELEEGRMEFFFDVPESSPTVRGFASMMSKGVGGSTPEEVLKIPKDFYQRMGLDKVLSHQRLTGLSAILAHMKRLATLQLEKSA